MPRLSLCLERIMRIAIGDVSFMIRELCGSIRMTPGVGAPTSPAFARKVILNFEFIIQYYKIIVITQRCVKCIRCSIKTYFRMSEF